MVFPVFHVLTRGFGAVREDPSPNPRNSPVTPKNSLFLCAGNLPKYVAYQTLKLSQHAGEGPVWAAFLSSSLRARNLGLEKDFPLSRALFIDGKYWPQRSSQGTDFWRRVRLRLPPQPTSLSFCAFSAARRGKPCNWAFFATYVTPENEEPGQLRVERPDSLRRPFSCSGLGVSRRCA
jgi:hypothetical protein